MTLGNECSADKVLSIPKMLGKDHVSLLPEETYPESDGAERVECLERDRSLAG